MNRPASEDAVRGDLEFGAIGRVPDVMAARHPDRTAIEDQGLTLTFAELLARVQTAQRALLSLGVAPGDRVAIQAPNMWQWIVAALAIARCGAVLVPVNTRYKGEETAWILARTGANVWFTVRGFLGHDFPAALAAAPAQGGRGRPLTTVLLSGDATPDELDWPAFIARSETVTAEQAAQVSAAVAPDTVADILFTSGTTGHPKGAMCTHRQALRAYRDWGAVVGLTSADRYLVVAPFFHAFGYKAGWLAALMVGAVILPEPVFDAAKVLARIGPDQISMLPGPPALYQTLLGRSDLGDHDLSTLRLAVTGAAVIPTELILRMRDTLGFATVITGYGLTEVCGVATMCRAGDDPEVIATTSGRALPGMQVRVVDSAGWPVANGEPGDVLVRGYNVMVGYLDDAEATRTTIDGDGWLHTGDIGVLDAAGNLRITDRSKDMFIMGGFNCYPAEIERVILLRDDVVHAAVIGVPDERMGEVGMAFVVPRADAALGDAELADAIIAWCRERLANFKVPRHVRVVPSLPMNAAGKVQKFKLRATVP